MADGYIKLHRKFCEWEWYSDAVVRSVFLHLLLNARWEDGRYKGHEIKTGQVVVTVSELAEELGYTTQQIRTAFSKLKCTGEIRKQSTNQFSVVTIENWGFYQGGGGCEQQTNNKRTTNEQQTNRVPTSIYKRNKEIYSAAVEHLNQVTGQHYKSTTKATQTKIAARLNEGFTLDDLIAVIDKKSADWKNNPKMAKFLRPETLFGSKFEGYLNEIAVSAQEEPERKKYDFTP